MAFVAAPCPPHDTPRSPVQTRRRRHRGTGPQRGRAGLPGLAGAWSWGSPCAAEREVRKDGDRRQEPRRPAASADPFPELPSGEVSGRQRRPLREPPPGQPRGRRCPLGSAQQGRARAPRPALRTPTRRAPGPLDVAPFGAAAYDVALTPEAVRRCPVKKTSVMFGGRKICLDLRYIGIYESESLMIITESGTHLMVPLNAARSAERGHREPSAAGPRPRLAVLCLLNNSSPASHGQERSRCKLWMRAPRRFVPSAPLASSSRAGRQSRLCQPGRLPLREKVH